MAVDWLQLGAATDDIGAKAEKDGWRAAQIVLEQCTACGATARALGELAKVVTGPARRVEAMKRQVA